MTSARKEISDEVESESCIQAQLKVYLEMEYILRAGRSLGNGMCRAVSALARGTRRILAYVPLLGITAVPAQEENTKLPTVQ